MAKKKVDRLLRFTKEDEQILQAVEPIVDGIAELFGSNCEVVLNSLKGISRSVVKIVNGHVTGRKVGAPLTDLGIQILENAVLTPHLASQTPEANSNIMSISVENLEAFFSGHPQNVVNPESLVRARIRRWE